MNLSIPQTICTVCGQPISNPIAGKIYCSPKCRYKGGYLALKELQARLKRGEVVRKADIPCAECGAIFHPQRSNQIFCSTKCRNRSSNNHASASFASLPLDRIETTTLWSHARHCKNCGAWFKQRHHAQLYCCKRCRLLSDGGVAR